MKGKKSKSVLGPLGLTALVFITGIVVGVVGVAMAEKGVMVLGGVLIAAAGGLAMLLGETMAEEFTRSQGGGAARQAQEEAERNEDEGASDMTVPEEWLDPPKRES